MSRTRWEASIDKRRAMKKAEEAGEVADSMEVRHQLLEKVRKGEATLEQVQIELRKIKRSARRNGQITRSQAYRRG